MPKLANMSLQTLTAADCSTMIGVIPFAALEPIGGELPLNLFQAVTESISTAVADLPNCVVLPQITTTYATPFQGFKGVVSLRRSVFMNVIADAVQSICAMGFRKVLFLDGTCYSKSSIDQGLKKFKRTLPEQFSYGIISWQHESSLKNAFATSVNLRERWRSEAAAVQIYAELTGTAIPEIFRLNKNISDQQFESWRKRTRDPEMLTKYFPEAHLSSWDSLAVEEPLFPKLTKSICETIEKG